MRWGPLGIPYCHARSDRSKRRHRGTFARQINRAFPDRTLYLFDTFDGFPEQDAQIDNDRNYSPASQDFSRTSIEVVLGRMDHPERCVVKKGYFPLTAEDLEDEFVFVSLDAPAR